MEVAVYNKSGENTGRKVELKDSIFAIEPNDHVIYLDCKQYMANNRQGTHSSLHRGIVSGSTKKLKKQKGTGTARFGSIKNPLFRGGGRVFGPEPRVYNFKLNKKVKRLARKSALTYKMQDNNIYVLDNLNFDEIKTKNIVSDTKGKQKVLNEESIQPAVSDYNSRLTTLEKVGLGVHAAILVGFIGLGLYSSGVFDD